MGAGLGEIPLFMLYQTFFFTVHRKLMAIHLTMVYSEFQPKPILHKILFQIE